MVTAAVLLLIKKYFLKMKKIANHGGLKNKHEVLGRNSRLIISKRAF